MARPNPHPGQAEAVLADPRWRQVCTRDRSADGQFYYSVRSTGVYCRPSCAARTPRPENVAFHRTPAEARAAGFRACKRCKPDQPATAAPDATRITAACRRIEAAQERMPALAELAAEAGLSEFHFHRLFKRATGLTPRQYAAAHRARRVRQHLERTGTVTEAIVDAGYGSSSRFYTQSNQLLGMTPRRFRAGGAGQRIRFALADCSLGSVLVAATDKGLCAVLLGDDPEALLRDLQDRFPNASLSGGEPGFDDWVASVLGLIERPGQRLDLPLDIRGTAFQQRVWQALRDIPPGRTASYAEVAARIGAPSSVRAVAQACGANAIAVVIPCHRVVRSDGALSGYRWGVARKQTLLDREAGA